MKALLSLLDNAQQDFPLLTVLKMVPFSLTDEELAQIRLMQTGQNVPFYQAFAKACGGGRMNSPKSAEKISEKLETWRFQAEVMRLSDFIWHLMTDSGYYAAVGALPKGEVRQGNLRMLYERAQEFEAEGGVTLAAFITRMDEQERGGGQHIRQNADRKRRFGARDDDAQIKGAGVPRGVPDEHGAQASVDADQ